MHLVVQQIILYNQILDSAGHYIVTSDHRAEQVTKYKSIQENHRHLFESLKKLQLKKTKTNWLDKFSLRRHIDKNLRHKINASIFLSSNI